MKEYRDHYFLKAKRENYPARSVYKLKELDAKFKLFRQGMRVLDLGAAPGSWSLGAAEKVGQRGLVLGCDIQTTETAFPPQVTFMQEDVFNRSDAFEARLREMGPFDVVMSDMAPRTTGTKFTDQARSLKLACEALEVARLHLKPGGSFIVKIFMGPDIQEMLQPMRRAFKAVKSFKPKSSRAESKETFFVGMGFKAEAPVLPHRMRARTEPPTPDRSPASFRGVPSSAVRPLHPRARPERPEACSRRRDVPVSWAGNGRAARPSVFFHLLHSPSFGRFYVWAQQMGQYPAPQGPSGRQARQGFHQGRQGNHHRCQERWRSGGQPSSACRHCRCQGREPAQGQDRSRHPQGYR